MEQIKAKKQAEIDEEANEAVNKIQRMWRNRYMRKLLSVARELKQKHSMMIIQKYLRGFAVYDKIGRKNKLNAFLKYFSAIRLKVRTNSQIKLAYYFRRYLKIKRQTEKLERAQLREEKRMCNEEAYKKSKSLWLLPTFSTLTAKFQHY